MLFRDTLANNSLLVLLFFSHLAHEWVVGKMVSLRFISEVALAFAFGGGLLAIPFVLATGLATAFVSDTMPALVLSLSFPAAERTALRADQARNMWLLAFSLASWCLLWLTSFGSFGSSLCHLCCLEPFTSSSADPASGVEFSTHTTCA